MPGASSGSGSGVIIQNIQTGGYVYAVDAEANDTYVATLDPAISAYTAGLKVDIMVNTANTAGATLNLNGIGAIAILKKNDQALETGDLEANQVVTLIYDGTSFQMQSQVAADIVHAPEGTAVLSTGEAGGSSFLREDGDGTSSWQPVPAGGISNVVEDLTPQLGGNLDLNDKLILGADVTIPTGLANYSNQRITALYADNTGSPTSLIVLTQVSTSAVAITEYKKIGGNWIFDPGSCAHDISVTLNFTMTSQTLSQVAAIAAPAGTGDNVLFVFGNNNDATDTFEFDTIVLTTGGTLTAVTGVVAGANQPTDTNNMATVSCAIGASKMFTIFQDDGHFADITESSGTYTLTYTDAKVLAIDTDIVTETGNNQYAMYSIGTQVLLGKATNNGVGTFLWEITTAGVLTEKFNPISIGHFLSQSAALGTGVGIIGLEGSFAVTGNAGGAADSASDECAFHATPFDLDAL